MSKFLDLFLTNEVKGIKSEIQEEKKESTFIRFLRLNKIYRMPMLSIIVIALLAITGGLVYTCWYLFIPSLWEWGFEPASWRGIFSVIGCLYLLIIPFIPFAFTAPIENIIDIYLSEQEERIETKFSELDRGQVEIEVELEKKDNAGLIPIIRYSRVQLEAYYRIGLDQTHRSFRYSIIAMWIGFVVIISGVGINFLPLAIRELFEVSNIQDIAIAGGTVIEIISALFLWVYKSSINQLTYFYNRQMDNHNVLMCQQIVETMEDADETKRLIIEKILDRGQKAEVGGIASFSKMKK